MQIVIDIPEEVYSFITSECKEVSTSETSAPITHIIKGILSGQVLPEGHSDLIDKDDFFGKYPELAIEPYINENAVIPADLGNIK